MSDHLPQVHRKKFWGVFAVIVAVAFFMLWSMRGGNTPAVIDQNAAVPPVPSAASGMPAATLPAPPPAPAQ